MEHVSGCLNQGGGLIVLNVTVEDSESFALLKGAEADATRLKSLVALDGRVFIEFEGNFWNVVRDISSHVSFVYCWGS